MSEIGRLANIVEALVQADAPAGMIGAVVRAMADNQGRFSAAMRAILRFEGTTEERAKELFLVGADAYDLPTSSRPPRHDYTGPVEARLPEVEWWPLRASIIRRDGFACNYCGDVYDSDKGLCADHVVPLSRGGTNDPDNLVCACLPCNSSKSDRLLSEWRGRCR